MLEAIPPTGDRLVAELDAHFPLQNSQPNQTHAQILFKAGQRSVIEFLLNLQKVEQEL